jgi:hypothetical protein
MVRRLQLRGPTVARVAASFPTFLPLVVMLMALAFFYLRHFQGSSGEACGCSAPRHVPRTVYAHTRPIEGPAPIIDIDERGVRLNGFTTEAPRTGCTDWHITKLHDDLVTLKNNFLLLHQDDEFLGTYYIVADEQTPYWMIARVRDTATEAGYLTPYYIVATEYDPD